MTSADELVAEFEATTGKNIIVTLTSRHWMSREDALRDVCASWDYTVRTGWEFAQMLSEAIIQYGRNETEKIEFLNDVANQTGVAVKTLQNTVSIVRSESALLAEENHLTLAHGGELVRLAPEEAAGFALAAAEQRWSVVDLRMAIRDHMGKAPQPKARTVVLEIEAGDLLDNMASQVVRFVKDNWGKDGLSTLQEWVNGAMVI